VLDRGDNEIFMGADKFKRFMASVEKIAPPPPVLAPAVTDVEIRASRLESTTGTTSESDEIDADRRSETDTNEFFTVAEKFLGAAVQTLTDSASRERVISQLVGEDEKTGERYLKIPLSNPDILAKAANALSGLLSSLATQRKKTA
jgi:hypothetical protein